MHKVKSVVIEAYVYGKTRSNQAASVLTFALHLMVMSEIVRNGLPFPSKISVNTARTAVLGREFTSMCKKEGLKDGRLKAAIATRVAELFGISIGNKDATDAFVIGKAAIGGAQ